MKFFSKDETIAVSLILAVIFLFAMYNFGLSIRRGRDAQRKSDLGTITAALNQYNEDMGNYPLTSPDGRIMACIKPGTKVEVDWAGKYSVNWILCEWGKDALINVIHPDIPPYLKTIPGDPRTGQGRSYRYISDGRTFQIYASLEGADEPEFNKEVAVRKLLCGQYICNFGKAPGRTPLDISIEEYENELKAK